MPCTLKYND